MAAQYPSSVLSEGAWYRIGVMETGLHRIGAEDLAAMGIDPSMIDPRNLRLYGNGPGMLDEANSSPRIIDLKENSIYVHGEHDGKFDPEDYLLFYGQSPVKTSYNFFYQQFEREINFYTDRTYYFLTTGDGLPGKRIQQGEMIAEEPTHIVSHFNELAWHEKEELNLIKSGKVWYGEVFKDQLKYDFEFRLAGAEISETAFLKVSAVGKSTTNTVFSISMNGAPLTTMDVPSVVLGSTIYARPVVTNYESFDITGEDVTVSVEFARPGPNDLGWLNYIEINYPRRLDFAGGQLSFRKSATVGPGNISLFRVSTGINNVHAWDVTDIGEITELPVSPVSSGFEIKSRTDVLREYIIFDGSAYFQPEFVEKSENQNLRSLAPVDFVIVSHPLFLEQARRLADHHLVADGMTSVVVTPQEIYNEFSSGAQDVTAIRDFMKMLYDRSGIRRQPRYLLLFGDASYDYKGRVQPDHNFVPAYQSRESLKWAASFVTDDYFGCLDNDEGSNGSGTVDVGIGRFPVHTIEQAKDVVDKSLRYMIQDFSNSGPWRNMIVYVGDDEDNNIHLNQAEGLAEITDSLGPVYNINKIYLDAYAQLQTPSGMRYPDVNAAINKSVEDGCLIMNYTGHGGEIGWATERVLDIPAIQAFRNIDRMPAFVTATCEFSRYDDPSLVSGGELLILNPNGGGVGLFTTTRLAYSQSNYALNKRFYNAAFELDSLTGEYPRMGDLIRVSKTPSNQNIKNFVLLGNPALMLAYPKMKVRTLSVFNENLDRPVDTIQAMSKITVTGQVEDLAGNILTGFNGVLHASVYDKPVLYKTRGNDPASKVANFHIQDKLLFRGESSVENGEFSFTFIVPIDISYQLGQGKISYYAVDTNTWTDAHGHEAIFIGGSDNSGVEDLQGPDISLYLNSLSFESGDLTTPSPMLIAKLFDESGINTVGNGIGHDIVAVIDGNYQMPVLLNDHYRPDANTFQSGEITYPLGPFTNGVHTLSLRAWDIFNNSSEKTITFQVNTGAMLIIGDAYAYPNPSNGGTYFMFTHNKPGATLDVNIQIFNLMGQPVRTILDTFTTESTESRAIWWSGLDESGNELSPGFYVYMIRARSDDGYESTATQKLIRIIK